MDLRVIEFKRILTSFKLACLVRRDFIATSNSTLATFNFSFLGATTFATKSYFSIAHTQLMKNEIKFVMKVMKICERYNQFMWKPAKRDMEIGILGTEDFL